MRNVRKNNRDGLKNSYYEVGDEIIAHDGTEAIVVNHFTWLPEGRVDSIEQYGVLFRSEETGAIVSELWERKGKQFFPVKNGVSLEESS